MVLIFTILALLLSSTHGSVFCDVFVYRATPGGISAAISAATFSANVVLLETTSHVGGMATEGGIGLRDGPDYMRNDTRNSQYQWGRRNAQHYGINDGVIWQPDHWVGEQTFVDMLREAGVTVMLETDFRDVRMNGTKMGAVLLESQSKETEWLEASFFIDASYEGALMQECGVVDYTFGRESASTYNESWGGVTDHSEAQFPFPINPFNEDGTLLRYINAKGDPSKRIGMSDDNIMAYSYRVCLTKDTRLYVPVTPPEGYNPEDFELARRLVLVEQAIGRNLSQPWSTLNYSGYERIPGAFMKYDGCCGMSPVGIDAVGLARGYATASRSERIQIAAQHRYYVQGLLWFWRTDFSVPKYVRKLHLEYGLCKDEWVDNGHFPRQLYVREAARMVGDRVFTQNDRSRDYWRHDSIAMGSWGLDIHDMQRTAAFREGIWQVINEGLTGYNQDGIFPFEIPYWILLPKRRQVLNLAVVSTPSVSHVAFAAIREEPTLWQLGQAAGTAAAIALSLNTDALHDVDIRQLQHALMQQGVLVHQEQEERPAAVERKASSV